MHNEQQYKQKFQQFDENLLRKQHMYSQQISGPKQQQYALEDQRQQQVHAQYEQSQAAKD